MTERRDLEGKEKFRNFRKSEKVRIYTWSSHGSRGKECQKRVCSRGKNRTSAAVDGENRMGDWG